MIEAISLACPKTVLDRSGYDAEAVRRFEETTGILSTRRTEESTLQLALRACRGLPKERWGYGGIVVVSQGEPIANRLQRELFPNGFDGPVFDVHHACAGFVYGLYLAEMQARGSLLVCVDKLRGEPGSTTDLIFSDAAVALAVWPGGNAPYWFRHDGSGEESLRIGDDGILHMDGQAVFDFVTESAPTMIRRAWYDDKGVPTPKIIQHQSNRSMMSVVERRVTRDTSHLSAIERFGNMSSASIGSVIAAHAEALRGERAILCGYGAGWSAAATIAEFPDTLEAHIEEFE